MPPEYFHQLITGISFAITSGTITVMGMLVGMDLATTSSKLAVIASLVIVAVADSLGDACGLHLVEESEMNGEGKSTHTAKEVWLTTAFTFLFRCGFVLTFAIPILLLPMGTAIPIDIAWGMLLLIIFNFQISKIKKENPIKIILEHVMIAVAVILVSYWIGSLIAILIRP